MSARYLAVSLLIGFVSGTLGGMLGFGGSSISTPLLRLLLNVGPLQALGTPLPAAIPTAVFGALGYHARGMIRFRTSLFTVLGGVPGVVIGALSTKYVSGRWLMTLTALVMLTVGIRCALSPDTPAPERGRTSGSSDLIAFLIGLPVGFFCGVLANGGGPLIVPLYLVFLGMRMQEAVGTSLAVVPILAIPGSLIHWRLGHIDPVIALYLAVAVIPASVLGSRLAARLGDVRLKRLFGWILVLFGIYFAYREWTSGLA